MLGTDPSPILGSAKAPISAHIKLPKCINNVLVKLPLSLHLLEKIMRERERESCCAQPLDLSSPVLMINQGCPVKLNRM